MMEMSPRVKITELQLPITGLYDSIFPHFDGRVFHGTDESIHDILRCGEIRPNLLNQYPSPYGGYSSFFKKRGCVALFDYRSTTTEHFKEHYSKCMPTYPAKSGGVLAYLFVSNSVYPDLLPWTLWKEEKTWSDMIVPYIEIGHRGPITLEKIEEILLVLVINDPVKKGGKKSLDDELVDLIHRAFSDPPPSKERVSDEMLNDPNLGHFWRNAYALRKLLEYEWKMAKALRRTFEQLEQAMKTDRKEE